MEFRDEWVSKKNPLSFYEDFHQKDSILLLSAKNNSFIAHKPLLKLTSFEAVRDFLEKNPQVKLFGFLSYPSTKMSVIDYPPLLWVVFEEVIEIEPIENSFRYRLYQQCCEGQNSEGQLNNNQRKDNQAKTEKVTFSFSLNKNLEFSPLGDEGLRSSLQQATYLKTVEKIKEDIKDGEYYQMNYTFFLKKESSKAPFDFFKEYYQKNPADYFCFIHLGNAFILSTSPELFLRKRDTTLIAQPIKGTVAKSAGKEALLSSEKDQAELNMITDLFRNDFFKVCKDVVVKKERDILDMEHLYHSYSEVHGRVKEGLDSVDLIKEIFPSGSITGCPKRRSQEAIDSYETLGRGVYTGSIGWLDKNSFCLNVAIRTLSVIGEHYFYPVGSGIVYDSDPNKEWEECLLKAKTFGDLA